MGVAFRGVEEEIADTGTRNVLVFWGDVCEDDSRCDFGTYPAEGCFPEVFFTEVGESKKPEDGFRDAGEDPEPGSECRWLNLG